VLEGCPGEWVELSIRGQPFQSLGLEHVDPERILTALRAYDLDSAANTSYPTALRRLLAGSVPFSPFGA
jgi:hypothetical protein